MKYYPKCRITVLRSGMSIGTQCPKCVSVGGTDWYRMGKRVGPSKRVGADFPTLSLVNHLSYSHAVFSSIFSASLSVMFFQKQGSTFCTR